MRYLAVVGTPSEVTKGLEAKAKYKY
jgi:hypothetical protein